MSLLLLPDKRVKQPFTFGKIDSRLLFANQRFSKHGIATQSAISGIAIAGGVADTFSGSEYKKTALTLPDTPVTIMMGAIQTADTGFRYLFASNYNSGLLTEPFTFRAYNGALEITSYNGASSSVSIAGAASGTYNTYFAELGAVGVNTATIGHITKSGVITKTSGSFSRLSTTGYDLYIGAGANGATPWRNYDNPILFTAVFRGKLSEAEKISIAKNPWQIFEPESVPFYFNTTTSGASGSLSWTEGNETTALTGSVSQQSSLSWTEANETSAITGALSQTTSLAWTEANETTVITGSVTDGQAANLAWTEGAETTVITGDLSSAATLSWTEASETISITAEQAQDSTLTLAWVEQNETCLISAVPEMSEIEKPFWLFYSLYQTEPEPKKPIKRIVKRQIKKLLDDVVDELIEKAEAHEKQRIIKSINEMKVAKLLETSKAEARKIIKEQIQKRLEYEDDEDVIFLLNHMY